MGNKKIFYLICVLFVITLSLGIVGFLNKDKVKDNNVTHGNSENIINIEYTGNQQMISELEDRFSDSEFVKAKKEGIYGYISYKIDGSDIKLNIAKEGIYSNNEGTPSSVEYTIKDIASPVAVLSMMKSEEKNFTRVYILDSGNNLYLSEFNADPSFHEGRTTYHYGIKNVESFLMMNSPLIYEDQTNQIYVIFRLSDGTYYTDYKFDETSNNTITQLINSTEDNNEEIIEEETEVE